MAISKLPPSATRARPTPEATALAKPQTKEATKEATTGTVASGDGDGAPAEGPHEDGFRWYATPMDASAAVPEGSDRRLVQKTGDDGRVYYRPIQAAYDEHPKLFQKSLALLGVNTAVTGGLTAAMVGLSSQATAAATASAALQGTVGAAVLGTAALLSGVGLAAGLGFTAYLGVRLLTRPAPDAGPAAG